MYKVLFLDTETTNKVDLRTPYDSETLKTVWPYITQISYMVIGYSKESLKPIQVLTEGNHFIKPEYPKELYSEDAQKITGITYEALACAETRLPILLEFQKALNDVDFVVAHNTTFDMKVIKAEFLREGIDQHMRVVPWIDTMYHGTKICNLRTANNRIKWPTLTELYNHFYQQNPNIVHNACFDVATLIRCFDSLVNVGELTPERIKLRIDGHVSSAK